MLGKLQIQGKGGMTMSDRNDFDRCILFQFSTHSNTLLSITRVNIICWQNVQLTLCNIIVWKKYIFRYNYIAEANFHLVGLTEYLSVCLAVFCNVGKLSSEYQQLTCNSVGTFVCLATKHGQWLLGWLTTTEKENVTTQQF